MPLVAKRFHSLCRPFIKKFAKYNLHLTLRAYVGNEKREFPFLVEPLLKEIHSDKKARIS